MKKNVVILHTDQQRYDSLGCCGDPSGTTPNLDALAGESCVGDRHISVNPLCQPSRASLFTGLYPLSHGVPHNGVALNRRELNVINDMNGRYTIHPQPETMADHFAAAGYDTVALGKLHLTPTEAPELYNYPETRSLAEHEEYRNWHGPYYGFRHVENVSGHGETPCNAGHYAHWLQQNHPDAFASVRRNNVERPVSGQDEIYPSPLPSNIHNTAWLADQAEHYIRHDRPRDNPFFLFVGFPDPHHPFTPPSDRLEKMGNRTYSRPGDPEGEGCRHIPETLQEPARTSLSSADFSLIRQYTAAMIQQIDDAVGQIINTLKDAEIWEDTVLLFTSDHGDYLGDHGLLYKTQHPDRSLVHLPCILHAPGAGLPARFSQPMSNADIFPTLAEIAGTRRPAHVQGRPLSEILKDPDPYAFTYCNTGLPKETSYSIFDRRYRLTWYPHPDHITLFDHENDPFEINNLSSEPAHRERAECLLSHLRNHVLHTLNPVAFHISPW